MEYLSRDGVPFSKELWGAIDAAVVSAAKDVLVGRRFLPLFGPVGGASRIAVIDALTKEEVFEDGFASFTNRSLVQLPQLYEDFWLYWRDLEEAAAESRPVDLSAARTAAQAVARREDAMIFYGVKSLGVEGLLTAKGVGSQKRSNWEQGEAAFTDVATAVTTLQAAGRYGRYTLVLSLDLFVQLQRIQPGTGVLESERIKAILDGGLFSSTVLQPKTAVLLCAQPQYMDLMVGQDMAAAFTEDVDLNHHLRVMETALPRIKAPDAIVVLK